ncbi:MAG: hypothetical protein FWH27_19490, partial [Planctomycetaceae bacterium]|nr:hypothetical protein [Planctomycetaceae bacterium]
MKKPIIPIIALFTAGIVRAAWMVEDAKNPENSTVYASHTQTNGNVIVSGELIQTSEVGFMLFDKIHGGSPHTQKTSKWILPATSGWVVYRFPGNDKWALTRYSLTSANDNSRRDPREWYVEGSNDLEGDTIDDVEAATWVPVDYQLRDAYFPGYWHTLNFPVTGCAAYNAYRLRIVRNGGDGRLTQLGQWRMMGYNGDDAVPELLSATGITHESVTLNGWVHTLGAGGFDAWLYCDTSDHGD